MFTNPDIILSWFSQYGYLALFFIAVIEGPIITVVAGFLSSLGIFSFFIAYITVVAGDLGGDIIHYAVGRWGGVTAIKRFGRYIGVGPERALRLEAHFNEKGGRTLLLGKLSHGIGGVFLVAAGLAKMPFGKFVWFNFIGSLPKSLLLLGVGFYFGNALTKIHSTLELIGVIVTGVAVIAGIGYFIFSSRAKKDISYE